MTEYRVKPYTWDYGSDFAVEGVKISSHNKGEQRYMFIPNTELYDIAVALADHIDGINK